MCPVYLSHREAEDNRVCLWWQKRIPWEVPSLVRPPACPRRGHEAGGEKQPAQAHHQVWKEREPSPHLQPWWGSGGCVGGPQPLSALSRTRWKPRSPRSLRSPHTRPLSGGAGCSLQAHVPGTQGQPPPPPWPFPGLRPEPSVPLPAQRRGPGRTGPLHRVTRPSVAEPSPDCPGPVGVLCAASPLSPARLREFEAPAGQSDEHTCHRSPVTCWEPVHPARGSPLCRPCAHGAGRPEPPSRGLAGTSRGPAVPASHLRPKAP